MNPNNPYIPKKYVPKIILKDGTEIKGNGSKASISDSLWLYPSEDISFMDAVTFFSDKNKTSHIVIDLSELTKNEYDGYTKLLSVSKDDFNNKIKICLTKET